METKSFEEAIKNVIDTISNFCKTVLEKIIKSWKEFIGDLFNQFDLKYLERIKTKEKQKRTYKSNSYARGKMKRYYLEKPNLIYLNQNIRKARRGI